MEPTTLSALALGVVSFIVAAGQWLSAQNRKRRRRDARTIERLASSIDAMSDWGDKALDHIYRSRAENQRHNADTHFDGSPAAVVLSIPPELEAGIRSVIIKEDAGDDE